MIPLYVLAGLAFAAYRATQLAVFDSILDTPRDAVFTWHANYHESKVRAFFATLIACVYCTGWWLSGAVLATYLLSTGTWSTAPLVVHGIEWLAVAGGQALLNRWDDTLPASS